jgi:hypothetical protein
MGVLGWVILSLAIWHFSIWVPDRFWGGIVGALIGSIVGGVVVGIVIAAIAKGTAVPGEKATDVGVVLFALPGSLLGMAAIYLLGLRRERSASER